jgi:3-phenylpropionate/cinnamic acid dioxygenase small subunit
MTVTERSIGGLDEPTLGPRIPYGDPLYCAIVDFLIEEAWLLDHDLLDGWVGLLDEDIAYFMPVRQTVLRSAGSGFDPRMGHYYDDLASIRLRVRRVLESEFAFAEDPPSRIRRHVTSVRVHRLPEPDCYGVTSSMLLLRNRWDQPTYDLVSAERNDVLRSSGESFKIARRRILVDQVTLGTPNLAFFF